MCGGKASVACRARESGWRVANFSALKVAVSSPLVKHLVSFRRMVFMVFKEGVGELNVVFKFTTILLSLLIQTLNVLNVVKLDILLEPALRGRVTTVFLSDWGGTRPSRPGSFPLWPWSG
ncbi:hypothetical protein QTP70_022487 [Hemibagrus guttatus]|uniref:Uncharacterized protein n=1 Tax=Hemibagrus guttatus TaxID=175788 RepID=A0AAE0ULN5_9TELE|nr:hypothetical protein QTP70_022487 [Hemibagrus guttatus]